MRSHAITTLIIAALTTQGSIAAALPPAGPSNARGERLHGRTSISTLDLEERDLLQDPKGALQSRGVGLYKRAPMITAPPADLDNLVSWIEDGAVLTSVVAFGGWGVKKGFVYFTSEAQRYKWAGYIATLLNAAGIRTQQYTASEIEMDTSRVIEIAHDVQEHLPGR